MKFISSSIFRSLCSLLVGLLLLFNAQHMPVLIIRVIGVLFLLPGVVGILTYLFSKFSKNAILRPTFPLMSIGSVLFGTYLELYPESFVTYLLVLLGAMFILAGINQFLGMIANRGISPFSLLLIILPLVLIGIGGYCITHAYDAAETVFNILGFTCIYYGLSDMFIALRNKHYTRVYERQHKKAEEAARRAREAEYVEFEVVNTNENTEG